MKISIKIYHWLPRVICIMAILFISLFALDAFSPGLTIWQQLKGFMIHLIPSFLLTGFLIIAWKREFIGGIIFMIIGIVFSPIIFIHNYNMNHSIWMSFVVVLVVTFPFILVGILFILSHKKKKSNLLKTKNN